MTAADALYERADDAYVGTEATRAGWHDNGQAGGAVLALLGHVLEDVPTLTPMSLTRLTVDIVRPVPVGERLHVATEILREGKKIQLVDLTVVAGDVMTTRARALRIRDRDVTALDGMPRSTTEVNPSASIPPPDGLEGVEDRPGVADFLRWGAELRRTFEPIDGIHAVWCRLRVPVVAGEPVRATSRAALPLDLVNLMGVDLDPTRVSAINPDVTGHMSRGPVGEWVALTGNTHYAHAVAHGVSVATMSDEAGAFGVTSRSWNRRRSPASGGTTVAVAAADESREGVKLTNLDQPVFDGAGATKRDLVDYLDAMSDRIIPVLEDRPLSVIRVHRGQEAFMQKNVPKYTPDFVPTVELWAETSKREVSYALCNDRRTLLWFANQRAIEYHPTLIRMADPDHVTHLVLDLDPPEGDDAFDRAVAAALLVRQALTDVGLDGAVKTSGAKGVHVFVPVDASATFESSAAATRAIAERAAALDPATATTAFVKDEREGKVFVDSTRVGGATVVAAYSPRVRPGAPVSFPCGWDALEDVSPRDFTIHTVPELLDGGDPWADALPAPQALPAALVEEGQAIPVARVQAMHEGKRRKRAAGG